MVVILPSFDVLAVLLQLLDADLAVGTNVGDGEDIVSNLRHLGGGVLQSTSGSSVSVLGQVDHVLAVLELAALAHGEGVGGVADGEGVAVLHHVGGQRELALGHLLAGVHRCRGIRVEAPIPAVVARTADTDVQIGRDLSVTSAGRFGPTG